MQEYILDKILDFKIKIYSFQVGFNKLLIGGKEKWNKFHRKGEGVVNGIDFFFSYIKHIRILIVSYYIKQLIYSLKISLYINILFYIILIK